MNKGKDFRFRNKSRAYFRKNTTIRAENIKILLDKYYATQKQSSD